MRCIAILAVACVSGASLAQVEVSLDAFDTDSIHDSNNLRDSRFRAYTSPNDIDRYDSYAKFDLSGIPDDARTRWTQARSTGRSTSQTTS